jgi:predicted site-specific integrase-resolvase
LPTRIGWSALAFRSIWQLCARHQCELLVLNQQSLSPEPALRHDVLTMLHDFSRRLDGLRNERNTVKEALAHGSDHDQGSPDPLAPNA